MKTRMFQEVTRTWNPVTGCEHNCSYCWARKLAEGRLRHLPRYRNGFSPTIHWRDIYSLDSQRCRFKKGLIFVTDMGDLFGSWVDKIWIKEVLTVIRGSPGATFLLLTKNPARYQEFVPLPPNVIAGATIETNRLQYHYSTAPPVNERYEALYRLEHPRKFVSIEPIVDFNLGPFASWIQGIAPEVVYVGMDNHDNHLPEPSLVKVTDLIGCLREFTEVRVKSLREAWNG